MTDFRYMRKEHELEEALEKDLSQLAEEKRAKAEASAEARRDPGGGLDRIAKGKTPLDEVKAVIEAKAKSKTAEEELGEHIVRQKLAEIKDRRHELVEDFLKDV